MPRGLAGVMMPPGSPQLGHDHVRSDRKTGDQRGGDEGQELAKPDGRDRNRAKPAYQEHRHDAFRAL